MSSKRASLGQRADGLLSTAANRTAQTLTGKTEREVTRLPIASIRRDGGTQPRAGLDPAVVEEYREVIRNGGMLPPVEVVFDGTDYWLWDGYHRLAAAEQEGETEYECTVTSGTRRDAVLLSVGANAEHGYRRTNEDKRRAVETLLNDREWSQWSDREIARQCKVSNQFVSNLRKELSVNDGQIGEKNQQKRVVKRGDQVYKQKTRNIGAPNKQRAEEQREKGKTEQAHDRMAAKLYELQEAVLAVVEGQPPMTYREIEFAVNAYLERIANPGLLSGAITQMTRDGRLRNVGGGRYAVPDAPRPELSDNGYQMEDKLSGNSLQIDGGEPADDWLDRQAIKTPSMATAANGEPAHSDDHNPDIEAALLLRSELERRVLRALDAIGAVLTIQGIRSLYLLDADQLRGLYGDLNDLSALGAEIHEYAEMQLGRMRLMGRTGRPYDEEVGE